MKFQISCKLAIFHLALLYTESRNGAYVSGAFDLNLNSLDIFKMGLYLQFVILWCFHQIIRVVDSQFNFIISCA